MSTKTIVITVTVDNDLEGLHLPGWDTADRIRRRVARAVTGNLLPNVHGLRSVEVREEGFGTYARFALLDPPERVNGQAEGEDHQWHGGAQGYDPALCEKACEDAGYYIAAFRATSVQGEVLTLVEQAREHIDTLAMLANDTSLPGDLRCRLAAMRDNLRLEARAAREAHCGDAGSLKYLDGQYLDGRKLKCEHPECDREAIEVGWLGERRAHLCLEHCLEECIKEDE
jgi:hypothetical protein